jgi:hypothetical protein
LGTEALGLRAAAQLSKSMNGKPPQSGHPASREPPAGVKMPPGAGPGVSLKPRARAREAAHVCLKCPQLEVTAKMGITKAE